MIEGGKRWPYPTVDVDGSAVVDEEGENQSCACGNDSWTQDWRAADREGRLSFDAAGSSDAEEFAVCPVCGRVYPNGALFYGEAAVAVARYDTGSAAFVAALARYDGEAYGGPAAGVRGLGYCLPPRTAADCDGDLVDRRSGER